MQFDAPISNIQARCGSGLSILDVTMLAGGWGALCCVLIYPESLLLMAALPWLHMQLSRLRRDGAASVAVPH